MAKLWPSLLLALLLGWCSAGFGQFLLYNGNQQLVFGFSGLNLALQDPTVTAIVISGNVSLPTTWVTPPVLVNRTLVFKGDPSKERNVLDFNEVVAALVVGEGANVEFQDLMLTNPGPQNVSGTSAPYVNYKCSGVGAWPSLILLDGAQVNFTNVYLQYYSQIIWARCANFAAKVKFQLETVMGYQGVEISPTNNATLTLTDSLNLPAPVVDINTNQTVGLVDLISENVTMTCITNTAALGTATNSGSGGGGGGFKWWYGVIIAVAAVAAIGLVLVALLMWRQRRMRQTADPQVKELSMNTPPPPTVMNSDTTSDDVKRLATLTTQPSLPISQPSVESDRLSHPQLPALPSQVSERDGVVGSDGWRSQASGSGRGGPDSLSEKKDSGSLSRLGLPWRDVADLLRNRSDFSDMEVGPLIGRGSFGRVYKGRWKGAYVALKIVDHSEAASQVIAQREGMLSTSAQHPNVITTYSVFLQRTGPVDQANRWAGEPNADEEDAVEGVLERGEPPIEEDQQPQATYIVLEYADRGTLEKAVLGGRFRSRTSGLPDMKSIHRCLLDVAGGMDYLHSVGVLHGDLKAANVLLKSTATDPRGFTCKLADFGMARLLETNRTHVSTHTYGTISYMPPELLREGKLTRAVDAFSFAILMWELFSGEMLHAGLTVAQVFYKVCYEHQKPPIPQHMPPEFEQLMVRCWDDEPSARPTFSEIFEALQAMPVHKAGRMSSSTPPSSTTSPNQSRELPPVPRPAPTPGPNPFAAASQSASPKA